MDKNKKTELDVLEQYLKDNEIEYVRIDEDEEYRDLGMGFPICTRMMRHQILIGDTSVICQTGSYGFKDGLLEAWFDGEKSPEGWLTAQDVINRV